MTERREDIQYIDSPLMQKMCHPIAMALFDASQEPMTPFQEHESALLESALGNPQQSFSGRDLYPTVEEKAAILYYSLIKNHPFRNGNKRTATATLLVFLHLNHFWIQGDQKENEDFLVSLATKVADSKGGEKREELLAGLLCFLRERMYTVPQSSVGN